MRIAIGLACAFAMSMSGFAALPAQAQEEQQQQQEMLQQQCAPRDEVIKVLAAKYQESQRALGVINEKAMMEIYSSPAGTWTMVVTNDAGVSCVLASGEAWDEMPLKAFDPSS